MSTVAWRRWNRPQIGLGMIPGRVAGSRTYAQPNFTFFWVDLLRFGYVHGFLGLRGRSAATRHYSQNAELPSLRPPCLFRLRLLP